MLIDMKMSKEEKREQTQPTAADAPDYAYGLRITLDDDALEKLGVKELPASGTYVTVVALCCVCVTSQYSTEEDEDRSVTLQIEKMRLGGDGDDNGLSGKEIPKRKVQTVLNTF